MGRISTRAFISREDITRALGAALLALALLAPAADAGHSETTCAGQDVPITADNIRAAEKTSLCLLNLYRSEHGLTRLILDPSLLGAARDHAEDMVSRDYFDHTAPAPAPNGTEPDHRAQNAGYRDDAGVGENIATSGHAAYTPHEFFDQWRTSTEGHNDLMLDRLAPLEAVGIGLSLGAPEVAADGGGKIGPQGFTAVQLFGTLHDDGNYTAADLEGGDPDLPAGGGGGDGHAENAAPCEQAKADRKEAKKTFKKTKRKFKKAQRKFKKAKRKGAPVSKRRTLKKKAKKLMRKRSAKRAKLRDATETWRAACA